MTQLLQPTLLPTESWADILSGIELLSQEHSSKTTASEKRSTGQIFTPLPMARQLISLIKNFGHAKSCYADPGTGTGILSAALLARHGKESTTPPKSLTAFETDTRLHASWGQNFADIGSKLGMGYGSCKLNSDFYKEARSILENGKPSNSVKATRIVTNPPYLKLGANEPLSLLLKEYGIYVPNHYAAFIALSALWLKDDGELLAIIPRSFFNGAYFKRFRNWLSSFMSIEHIVAYRSRSNFGRNVLQENICLSLRKRQQRPTIRISFCEHAEAAPLHDLVVPKSQILGDLWLLPSTPLQLAALQDNATQPHTLNSLGLVVKTGAVEVHRQQCTDSSSVKVLYSRDFNAVGDITWGETKKPRYFALDRAVSLLPDDGRGYVVIKRITANDGDKNRIMPVWISQETTFEKRIGFDNHVQVFSFNGEPMSKESGLKLVEFLRSKEANFCMSSISGTTQINIDDLKALNYPPLGD